MPLVPIQLRHSGCPPSEPSAQRGVLRSSKGPQAHSPAGQSPPSKLGDKRLCWRQCLPTVGPDEPDEPAPGSLLAARVPSRHGPGTRHDALVKVGAKHRESVKLDVCSQRVPWLRLPSPYLELVPGEGVRPRPQVSQRQARRGRVDSAPPQILYNSNGNQHRRKKGLMAQYCPRAQTSASLPLHGGRNSKSRPQHTRYLWCCPFYMCNFLYNVLFYIVPYCQTLCIYNFRWLPMPSDKIP